MKFRIYYINLDSRTDRRELMERQLTSLGMPATRIAASTGPSVVSPNITAAEAGCFISHINAWQDLLGSDADAALVLEDDALLSSDLPAILDSVTGGWFDLLRLEWRPSTALMGRTAGHLPQPYLARRQMSGNEGSAGYIVTREAALRLKNHPRALTMPVDNFLFGVVGVHAHRIYQLFPSVIISVIYHDPASEAGRSDLARRRGPQPKGLWHRMRRRVNKARKAVAPLYHFDLADLLVAERTRPAAPSPINNSQLLSNEGR